MTEGQRTLLIAMYLAEKPYNEIAAAIGQTRNYLMQAICRMRKAGELSAPKRKRGGRPKNRNHFIVPPEFTYYENGVWVKRYPAMYSNGVSPQKSAR